MQSITDWAVLWRELVEARAQRKKRDAAAGDVWHITAREFDDRVAHRWATPDSSRRFVVAQLDPDATILDIGAGTGAWAVLLARHARKVTAVEESPAMIEVMRENLRAEAVANVEVVEGTWPDVVVEPHDFSLCSHGMYGSPDLPAFIRAMVAATRRACFLLLRATTVDGVMAEATRRVWGQPNDSANFTVAYNVLLQMGIYANVLMEDTGLWKPRTSASLEDALAVVKRRLGLVGPSEHDEFLAGLLRERRVLRDGRWGWPPDVRSALVYWTTSSIQARHPA
jgi:precorrin-6B methylase 2